MKTKHGIFFGFAVMLAAAIFTLSGCPTDGGGGSGGGSTPETYTSIGTDGNRYELTIIKAAGKAVKGDNYVLTIFNSKGDRLGRSTGTIDSVSGETFTLKLNGKDTIFKVTVSEKKLTGIPDPIPLDGADGGSLPAPGNLTPETPGDNSGGNNGGGDNGSGDNGGNVPTTNGSLTITGIPEEYEGKYIVSGKYYYIAYPTEYLIAVESIQWSEGKATCAKISNGSATLKVYKMRYDGVSSDEDRKFEDFTLEGYSGNETVGMVMNVLAFPSMNIWGWDVGAEGDENNPCIAMPSSPVSVTFTNGRGTVSVAGVRFETDTD